MIDQIAVRILQADRVSMDMLHSKIAAEKTTFQKDSQIFTPSCWINQERTNVVFDSLSQSMTCSNRRQIKKT